MTKKPWIRLAGVALALVATSAAAQQAVVRKWDVVIDGAAHSTDAYFAMSTDGFGNTYMTGNTRYKEADYYANGIEARTVKVDKFGVVQWSNAYAGTGAEGAEGVAIDNDVRGNVIIAANDYETTVGTGATPAATIIKYDADGNSQWVQTYPNLVAKTLKVDATGASYLAGMIPTGAYQAAECVLVRYSADGVPEWERRLPGTTPDGASGAIALAVMPDDGVAISCGTKINSGVSGLQTAVFDADGSAVWQARHEDAGRDATPRAMLIDDAGNLVIAGKSTRDYLVTKFSPTGAKLWSTIYDGGLSKFDYINDLALDNVGNVIVTGAVNGQGYLYTQVGTVKFSGANGSVQWASRYGTGMFNEGSSVRVDGNGNVLVLAASNNGQVLLKYTAGGTLSWSYVEPAGNRQLTTGLMGSAAIGLDARGCFVVAGTTTNPQVSRYVNNDLLLIKYCLGEQSCS